LNRSVDFFQLTICHRISSDFTRRAAELNEMPLEIHRTFLQNTVVPTVLYFFSLRWLQTKS